MKKTQLQNHNRSVKSPGLYSRETCDWFTIRLLGSQGPTPNVLAQGRWTACQGEEQWDLGPGAALVAVMAWGRNPEQTGK